MVTNVLGGVDHLGQLQFENTAHCQAHCKFCPIGDPKKYFTRKQGTMKQDVFEKIIHDGMELGVNDFIPFLNGEPLLAKNFFPQMDYMAERNLAVTIFTNVDLLDREKADRLAAYSNVKFVMLSFHGGTKETYEHTMGLDFEKSKANAEYFLSIAKMPVSVYMLSYEDTLGSEAAFRQMWGTKAFVSDAFYNWAGMIPNERSKGFQHEPIPCSRALNNMTILYDGTVSLCCMDLNGTSYTLGNVMQRHIGEIWDDMQWIRDKHHQRQFAELPLCKECTLNRY